MYERKENVVRVNNKKAQGKSISTCAVGEIIAFLMFVRVTVSHQPHTLFRLRKSANLCVQD